MTSYILHSALHHRIIASKITAPYQPAVGFISSDYNWKKLFLQEIYFKGVLSGLRQFWGTETPLKMMKNPFYFTLKTLFVLNIFKFLSSKTA